MIDLRSDTLTRPTPPMLEAMFEAEVGDDVFNEDPTVNHLQEKVASLFGMEAALFCPSGTMCNQIAIRVHTRPQDEVICDKRSHVYLYEGGGMFSNSLVSVRLLDGDRGRLTPQQIAESINPDNIHFPRSSLVSLENTCNKGGGSYYNVAQIAAIAEVCRAKNLRLHMDGARIFNALVETGESPKEYGTYLDSISVCLSKGLGAPVGSVLIGSHDFIKEAFRVRKAFGGGMRQAGYMAAAGVYALDHHRNRLAEDHQHARMLGNALEENPHILEVMPVDTNIVIFRPNPQWKKVPDLLDELKEKGIWALPFGTDYIRMVMHLDISPEMVVKAKKTLLELK